MASFGRSLCLLLAAWAALVAPAAAAAPCNNATHHDDALVVGDGCESRQRGCTAEPRRGGAAERRRRVAAATSRHSHLFWYLVCCSSPQSPFKWTPNSKTTVQTYFITGNDLRVKDIKVDARGISAELETKASDLGDALPYIVRPGGHGWKGWLMLRNVPIGRRMQHVVPGSLACTGD